MISLKTQDDKRQVFIKISSEDNESWRLEVGPWFENGEPWRSSQNFLTKEKILLKKSDLVQLGNEIEGIIKNKIREEAPLELTFWKNEPQLRIVMHLVDEDHPYFSPERSGMVEFTPYLKNKYLDRALGRPEDEIYRDMSSGMVQYYSPEDLLKFADEIKAESKAKST